MILSKQEIFIKLAADKKPFVRTALAQNPEIDKEIQDYIDNLPDVDKLVAETAIINTITNRKEDIKDLLSNLIKPS
jgi:hypothetical protein